MLLNDGIKIIRNVLKKVLNIAKVKQDVHSDRSLLSEFLSEEHTCTPLQGSSMAIPIKFLDEFTKYENLESSNVLWNIKLEEVKDSCILGMLKASPDGYLIISEPNNSNSVPIVVYNKQSSLYELDNSLVMIQNFCKITEIFSISDAMVEKHYLKLNKTEIIPVLQAPPKVTVGRVVKIKMKIFQKSSLLYSMGNKYNFFFVKAAAYKRTEKSYELVRNGIFKLNDKNCLLYSYLCEGSVVSASIQGSHITPLLETKCFLAKLDKLCFGNWSDYVEMPVLNVFSISYKEKASGISEIGSLKSDLMELVSVEGIVMQRCLMTSKFPSEINSESGFPGSKILRCLIKDVKDGASVWVYISPRIASYQFPYPIGLLSGTLVRITALKVHLSANQALYLKNTEFTTVNFLKANDLEQSTFSNVDESQYVLKSQSKIENLPTSLAFTIIATVVRIFYLRIFHQCDACNSEVINGRCTYVGCITQEDGAITGHAKVLLDNGVETAVLMIKGAENMQVLLCLSDEEWTRLNNHVIKEKQQLTYANGQYYDYENEMQQQFSLMCESRVLTPFRIYCRRFAKSANQPRSNGVNDLFCIKLYKHEPIMDEEDSNLSS